jgi:hypothetical protein
MNMKKIVTGIALAAGLMLGGLSGAKADVVTFAQFQQQAAGNPFTFTNTGSTSTFTVNIPVKFEYLVNNGYTPLVPTGGVINAILTLNTTVDGTASNSGGKKPFLDQSMQSTSMTFTAVTPLAGRKNLLTISNSTGDITGFSGANSGNFTGDTTAGDVVTFSSDFLDFSNTINRDFALSFSSILPMLAQAQNGYLANFTASGTGTFASDPAPINRPVPEPSSVVTLGLGAFGLLALTARGRKTRRTGALA